MVHQPTDLLPAAEVPDFDDLVGAARCEPFTAFGRGGDGLDAGNVRGEYKNWGQVESVGVYRGCGSGWRVVGGEGNGSL